jgi:ribosome biogenesis SPOUT family RNA methylase Rps3
MAKARILVGNADGHAPSAATPEDAASEYFINRMFMGDHAPRPPVERWREDQREPFLAELQRLEDERRRQLAEAQAFAARRSA